MNLALMTTNWNQVNRLAEGALRAPRTPEDYDRLHTLMHAITDEMARAGHDPDTSPLGSLFEIVAALMHAYELEHEPPIEESTPAEMLTFLMEQNGLTQTVLAQQIGVDQGLISKIASGRRAVSKDVATRLAERFKVDPAVFT
jgi:HTH-type transcriptional regulator/antitoxin HigA